MKNKRDFVALMTAVKTWEIEADRYVEMFFQERPFLEDAGQPLTILPQSPEGKECETKLQQMQKYLVTLLDNRLADQPEKPSLSENLMKQTKVFEES